MKHVTIRQLQTMLAISRNGKISSAANSLGLTGPAVTLSLKDLEAECGQPLFDRTRDGLRPTVAGDAVLKAATDIELRLRRLYEEIETLSGAKTGRLRIGAVSTAKYFAPTLMAAFRAERPGVNLSLAVGNRETIIEALKNYEIDMALMGRPPRDFDIRAQVFGDHPLVIIASPTHPLAHDRNIEKEQLIGEHFLVREKGSGTRSSLDIFMRDAPGWTESDHEEMASNETIKQAVMAGMGIAFISAHTIAMELELKRLVILDVAGMPIRRQWYAVSRADRSLSPAMTAFNSFLVNEGARHLPFIPTIYPVGRG